MADLENALCYPTADSKREYVFSFFEAAKGDLFLLQGVSRDDSLGWMRWIHIAAAVCLVSVFYLLILTLADQI
jgi:hypothetical protein